VRKDRRGAGLAVKQVYAIHSPARPGVRISWLSAQGYARILRRLNYIFIEELCIAADTSIRKQPGLRGIFAVNR